MLEVRLMHIVLPKAGLSLATGIELYLDNNWHFAEKEFAFYVNTRNARTGEESELYRLEGEPFSVNDVPGEVRIRDLLQPDFIKTSEDRWEALINRVLTERAVVMISRSAKGGIYLSVTIENRMYTLTILSDHPLYKAFVVATP